MIIISLQNVDSFKLIRHIDTKPYENSECISVYVKLCEDFRNFYDIFDSLRKADLIALKMLSHSLSGALLLGKSNNVLCPSKYHQSHSNLPLREKNVTIVRVMEKVIQGGHHLQQHVPDPNVLSPAHMDFRFVWVFSPCFITSAGLDPVLVCSSYWKAEAEHLPSQMLQVSTRH